MAIERESAPRTVNAWSGTHLIGAGLDPEAQRINFSWLVRLRWGAIAGQVAAIVFVHYGMSMPLPLAWLALVIGAAMLFNLGCTYWVRTPHAVREPMAASAMAVDVALLTALLYFTGGPSNPFSFLYLVHIALAAVVLRSWWTWSLVALSLVCFGALFVVQHDDPHAGHRMMGHMDHGMHDGGMSLHLQGMWVAFGIAAAFIVYFVSRVTRDLSAREAELLRVRAVAGRNENLAALATLAAGAAHELATPLSTIAIAAKELEQSLERAVGTPADASGQHVQDATVLEDVRLIRSEVARCRAILQQLSVEAGQSAGEGAVRTRPEVIATLALEGLVEHARVDRAMGTSTGEPCLLLPEQAVALALRGLLKNALEASTGRVVMRVHAAESSHECVVEVIDQGSGMPESVVARVGEPFFTTKPPGQGMGLGVFVARALCEQVGGKLEIESTVGRGTTVRMRFPLEPQAQAAGETLRALKTV